MGINEKLMRIQTEIKAPKKLYNSFGKYNYRNAESICEAVKPYLTRENVVLTLSDEIVEIGGRVYVKATAQLGDTETQEIYKASAYARESAEKRGMDESQITGTASSYARKYALNGLFLLDDTKDADSDEYHNQTSESKNGNKTEQKPIDYISEEEFQTITKLVRQKNVNEQKLMEQYHVDSLIMLTRAQYTALKQKLEKVADA